MGELKSCLFCGKSVDQAFEYCPHCGYEFGEGEDHLTAFGQERLAFGGERSDPAREMSRSPSGAELPVLVEEESGECAPAADEDYLFRLRTLQEILSNMERELDHILATEGELNRGGAPRSGAEGGS